MVVVRFFWWGGLFLLHMWLFLRLFDDDKHGDELCDFGFVWCI